MQRQSAQSFACVQRHLIIACVTMSVLTGVDATREAAEARRAAKTAKLDMDLKSYVT